MGEKLNIQYSTKNIPYPTKDEYYKLLVIKMESFLRRLRWHILHACDTCETKNSGDDCGETFSNKYGFKTEHKPPFIKGLEAFEKDFLAIPRTLKFRNVKNTSIQNDMKNTMKSIKLSNDR